MKTAYDVIISPIISEQTMDLAREKKYAFKVAPTANKSEIKQAVEEIFDGVEVKKVNVANYDGKLKRLGRTQGRRSSYKKAIVTVSADSKPIEFFEGL
ncbi:MAG: 50S ribosomal protein L23 [Firmicutes bacterium]|nr:50S ribosomal protein L23 [Bacillota bacterium]MBQ6663704.1 50S ribosomal protein L23 [Bacillota bacterium]MCR4712609.1 50S ribosomal protein L23 [Clostridia bacterium]